jgi:hypothetical protein
MVVSHGGLLTAAFGKPEYGNVEFRVFDMVPADGSFTRVSPECGTMPTILRTETKVVAGEEVVFYVVRFGDEG